MRIINVITTTSNEVDSITSIAVNVAHTQEAIDKAQELFKQKAIELGWDEDDDCSMEFYLQEGHYSTKVGGVSIIWSVLTFAI
jgi:hypothetical protein